MVRTALRRHRGFRPVALVILLLGATGGGFIGLHRQQESRVDAEEARITVDSQLAALDEMKLYADKADTDAAVQAALEKAATEAKLQAIKAKKADEFAKRAKQKKDEASRSENRTESTDYGPVPASCKEYSGNRAIGCALMLEVGFPLSEMPCLDKMWTKESNWRTLAENTSSGAYGIPQALPGDKMASEGSDWRTNAVPQIKWGLGYIKGRYDTPCGAWEFWLSHNFY